MTTSSQFYQNGSQPLFLAFRLYLSQTNADSVMTIKFWTMGSLGIPGQTWSANFYSNGCPSYFSTQYRGFFNAMMMGDKGCF